MRVLEREGGGLYPGVERHSALVDRIECGNMTGHPHKKRARQSTNLKA